MISQEEIITSKDTIKYDTSTVQPIVFDNIENYQNDKAFSYHEAPPPDNWYTRFKKWLGDLYNSFIKWLLGGQEAKGILGFIVQSLPYLILIAVVGILVWLFMKADMAGSGYISSGKGNVILSNDQEIIENEDINALIEEALKQKNYRLAVRYYYLLVLQKLSNKELIDWQFQKTNHDYIYEIKNEMLRKQFVSVTRIYDFIWYGNFDVNEEAFAKAKLEFSKINEAI